MSGCLGRWLCVLLASIVLAARAGSPPEPVPDVIQKNYDTARRTHESKPADDQAAWQFGRACFDRAEFARDTKERAALAKEGMAACREVIARQPKSAQGHYYLGMNMAQLARTKLLGALPLLSEMENEWATALALDQKLDYAGPDRLIGLLFRDAPGWPVSLGDTPKARQHLLRAVELSPNYPENQLNLIESQLGWNETAAARHTLEKFQPLLPAARLEFVGDYWAPSWKDWNRRLEKIETKLNPHHDSPL